MCSLDLGQKELNRRLLEVSHEVEKKSLDQSMMTDDVKIMHMS
jgi:hypothetical protein